MRIADNNNITTLGDFSCGGVLSSSGGITSTGNLSVSNSSTGSVYTIQSVNPNATNSIIGVGAATLSSGAANSGNMVFFYQGPDNPANSVTVGLSGAAKPSLTFQNNFSAAFNCSVEATPRWGNGYLAATQTIPAVSNGLIAWTASTAGPLTRTSTRFTYTGTTSISVQVSFTANWQNAGPTFFSGVWISVRKNGSSLFNVTKSIVDSVRVTSTSSTTIVPLSTNDYFEILASNLETLDMNIIGGPFLVSDCAVMSYYILN